MTGRWRLFWVGLAALLLLPVGPALAHRVLADAYLEGDQLVIESFFPDGKPVIERPVTVDDQTGHRVAEAKTDRAGQCRIDLASVPAGRLTIVVDAGLGHRAETNLDWPGRAKSEKSAPMATQHHNPLADEPPVWLQALKGLAVIALLAGLAFWWLGRRKRR